jgi:hypothetical protein
MPGEFSGMQQTLQQPTLLGSGYDTAPMGVLFGGGGGVLVGPAWIGGKGFALIEQTTPHGTADTKVGGGGGGFELGYALVATDRWLVVPYMGLGGFSYSMKVTNKSPTSITLYPNETIGPGVESSYSASLWTGEFGLRANRLIFWGDGGMTVGAEIGYMASLTRDAWTGATTASPESAQIRGAYFKILVGGGAFLFDHHEKHEPGGHEAAGHEPSGQPPPPPPQAAPAQ